MYQRFLLACGRRELDDIKAEVGGMEKRGWSVLAARILA